MQSKATSVEEYINELPADRKKMIQNLRKQINQNIPRGFKEEMSYGFIGWVIPHRIYPAGYHCNPKLPLPFVNIASQKNFVAFYHMGIYADNKLLDWFTTSYIKQFSKKPDMGKSCIRFKKEEEIPYALIAELMQKITVKDWMETYERLYKKKK